MLKILFSGVSLMIFGLFAAHSPLDGFNVVVKDIVVAGKTVRVSPFAGIGVVTVSLCFKNAGQKLAQKNKETLVALLTRSLGESTDSKTREQLQAYSRDKNVQVSFGSDDDHFTISGKCPANKLAELFSLIKDLLLHARFNDADLKRFKDEVSASLMQAMQSPNSQLNELEKEIVYKNHPYGTSNKNYLASLKNVTVADLKTYVKTHFTKENLIISACGEFDEAKLVEQLDSLIAALPKKFKANLPKDIVLEGPYQIHSKAFPVPQTVVKFWHKGIGPNHPDFFALQIAVGCLSDSFVGLLFKKVRVERGLTYGIGAGLAMQEHFNGFAVSTFTQTASVDKLIETVREVFTDVCKSGFPPELIENIKQSFIGNYKRSFASSTQIASRLTNYQLVGRPVDFHKILIEKIAALTPEQVTEAFKKFLNPDQFVIFTVGQ